jgi:histidine triad (HIT) family protein
LHKQNRGYVCIGAAITEKVLLNMDLNLASTECFLCQLQVGKIPLPGGTIYEDDLVYVGHIRPDSQATTYLGCLIAQLKRHVPGLAEQTDEEARALGLVVARLARALKTCEGAEHIYSFVIGHGFPHLHIRVVPRYPGAPKEYWGTSVDLWPDAPRGGSRDIEKLCERLRHWLNNNGNDPSNSNR